MSLDRLVQKILLQFGADTRQAKRGTKELETTTSRTATSIHGSWMRVAGGVAAVTGAVATLRASIDAFALDAQMRTAAAGADVDRLKDAFAGLVTETEVLQFAAAAMNTEFALTQTQMEEVARFMRVLRAQGNDMAQVQQRVTQAIVEGNARALRPFGIIIDETSGSLEAHKAILEAVREENAKFTEEQLKIAGDETKRAFNEVSNLWNDLKVTIGGAVEGVAFFVNEAVEGMRITGNAIADFFRANLGMEPRDMHRINPFAEFWKDAEFQLAVYREGQRQLARETREAELDRMLSAGELTFGPATTPDIDARAARIREQVAARREAERRSMAEAARQREAELQAEANRIADIVAGLQQQWDDAMLELDLDTGFEQLREEFAELDAQLERSRMFSPDEIEAMNQGFSDMARAVRMPMSPLQELIRESEHAAQAFHTFQMAGTRAFVELGQSSMNFREAMRSMFGDVVQGLGTQLIQQGLAAIAEGGIMMFTPGAQAAAAGKIAAGSAAITAGTGIVAVGSRLGGRQGAAGAGSRGAGVPTPATLGPATPATGGDGGQHLTVVLGSEWLGMGPTEREHRFSAMMREVRSGDMDTDSVNFR